MDDIKKIADFLFELNESKRTLRHGWHRMGVKCPESVAEHTAATAQIAFILTRLENADAGRAVLLALFHDIGEVRSGDDDWVSKIYHDKNSAEAKAYAAQIKSLPVADELEMIGREMKEQKTREAMVAKDADLLELAVQAKVYADSGYRGAPLYIEGMRGNLKTGSAKKILAGIEKGHLEDWWLAIPEIAAVAEKIFKRKRKGE